MPKFRTKIQNSKMFALASQLGLAHEDLKDFAAEVSNGRTDRTSKLYIPECDEIISRLEKALNIPKTARRTVNYHRQKAGVEQLATPTHKDFMNRLARGRQMSEDGIGDLSARVNGGNRTPRTSKEVNRVIEVIKAMNQRDKDAPTAEVELKEAA